MTTATLEYFTEPSEPGCVYAYSHEHEWIEIGAQVNPNGTWSSVWACVLCPDIGIGGKVGPVPAGYCPCGWVQRKPNRKRCEECKRPMGGAP